MVKSKQTNVQATKSKSQLADPYVQSALLCDRALQEKDETYSIIRIIEKVTATIPQLNQSALANVSVSFLPIPLVAFFVIRTPTHEEYEFTVDVDLPDGKNSTLAGFALLGGYSFYNAIVHISLPTDKIGTCTVNLRYQGTTIAWIPIDVVHQNN